MAFMYFNVKYELLLFNVLQEPSRDAGFVRAAQTHSRHTLGGDGRRTVQESEIQS